MRILNMRECTLSVLTVLLSLTFVSRTVAQPDGEKLFKSTCSACHTITDKKLIGPGLADVEGRWEDKSLLYSWIKNSQSVVAQGDPYATALFEQFNKSIMPAQAVSDADIDAILNYINNPPVAAVPAAEAVAAGAGAEAESSTMQTVFIMLGIVILLIVVVSLLRNLMYTLRRIDAEREGLPVPVQLTMFQSASAWINRNKTLFAVILIVFTVGVAKAAWDALLNVGIYEGYQPEQPIKFSHKIHAGAQKIDCNYCHSAARHGRTAGIPSASICMNCHKFIQEGPTTGTAEIAKIYASIGWDPEAQSYSAKSTGPIKWVKIHNLPDLVYFNHSQHITVGNIACQTCHGKVEEMDVLGQFAPLTMGWCINCHRQTKLSTEGNGYYDEMHKRLPEKLREEFMKDGKVTVSEYGGLECAKCHY